MIIVIDALNRDSFSSVLDDMYRLRARVFQDRMGWDVSVQNGREVDEFDDLDPAYVICLDEDYEVIGCARLLQTTGPHMLSDVFHAILDGEPPLRSATLWESTRFCIDREKLSREGQSTTVSTATCELMLGILEYARDAGISDIITVIDPIMDRVLKRSDNAPYDYVGKVADMGVARALAALIDCSDERIARVRAFAGIEGDIFVSEEQVLAGRAAPVAEPLGDDLQSYCDEQLTMATTARERAAAIALRQALAGMLRSRRDCDA